MKQYISINWIIRLLFLLFNLKTHQQMKKYSIIFSAFIYAGGFNDLDNAANACSEGSGKIFTETHSEALGDHVAFTDANGDSSTIQPGDGIQPVTNEDGSFKGYLAVDASVVKSWVEVTDATNQASGTSTTATGSTDGSNAAG